MAGHYETIQAEILLSEYLGIERNDAASIILQNNWSYISEQNNIPLEKFIDEQIQSGFFNQTEDAGGEVIPLDDSQLSASDSPPPQQSDSKKPPFKVLGYSGDKYYYFPHTKRQIVTLTPSQHTINNLLQLADVEFWRKIYGANGQASVSTMTLAASNFLIEEATKKGIFDEAGRVRGCGAWVDDGRVVLHCGDKLIVDGAETEFNALKSKFTYVAAARMINPHHQPLTNAEAVKLRYLCEMPTWDNKLSGSLLAGWLVIAPICAALEWRPHIWITGEAESGKSTIINSVVKKVLGDIALCFDGGTTEAAIRMFMKHDARPIVYDEAEKNKHIMEGVLALSRLASSGGRVGKFGQSQFTARFASCFSGINPPIKEFADETRISLLKIKQNRKATARQDYRDLLAAIEDTITKDFSGRLFARIVKHLPVLLQNITTFRLAANNVIRGARASDQIAPMLAGLFFLHSVGEITQDRAEEFIKEQDWSFHTTISEDRDSKRCVQHLSSYMVRYNPNNGTPIDVTVGDLIECVLGYNNDINKDWAKKTLRNMSILIKDDGIVIANRCQHLERVFKDTHWSVGWSGAFEAIDGHVKEAPLKFGAGNTQRGVRLPLSVFIGDEAKPKPIYDIDV